MSTKVKTTYPCLLRSLVLLPQVPQPVVLFPFQVGVLLDFGLVESIDNGVLALPNEHLLDLSLIVEAHLAHRHAAIFLQI